MSKANRVWLRRMRDKRVKRVQSKENPSRKTDRAIAVLSTAVNALQFNTNVAEVTTNPNITTLAVLSPAVSNTNNSVLARIPTRQGN